MKKQYFFLDIGTYFAHLKQVQENGNCILVYLHAKIPATIFLKDSLNLCRQGPTTPHWSADARIPMDIDILAGCSKLPDEVLSSDKDTDESSEKPSDDDAPKAI